MLNKSIKSGGNVIQNLRRVFLSLSITEIVNAESNTFYKYEYE